jgi:hypothetical protein
LKSPEAQDCSQLSGSVVFCKLTGIRSTCKTICLVVGDWATHWGYPYSLEVTHGVSQLAHVGAPLLYANKQVAVELVSESQAETAEVIEGRPVSLKSSSAHSDLEGPAVINPPDDAAPVVVGVVLVVVVVEVVVVEVVVVEEPPPDPPPLPPDPPEDGVEAAPPDPPEAGADDAPPDPPEIVVTATGEAAIGTIDEAVAQIFTRPEKRLL